MHVLTGPQAHMHHKFAVIDGRLLVNGSFNWTRQAVLYNQENCVVTDNPQLVRRAVPCCGTTQLDSPATCPAPTNLSSVLSGGCAAGPCVWRPV